MNSKKTFFIQAPIGLEDLCLQELNMKWPALCPTSPLPPHTVLEGGILIDLPIELGLHLNYWLKIPNRILLRLEDFKCRDFPKLYKKIKQVNWKEFFAGQELEIKSTSHKSRLFDDRKIVKAIRGALNDNIKALPPKKVAQERVNSFNHWKLFVRLEEDWCTVSIDTSGERLGIRGYKKHVGRAPLRENLAAALFFEMFLKQSSYTDEKITLLDPCAGSGTIALESQEFFTPNINRQYSFEYFPCYSGQKPSPLKLENRFQLFAIEKNKEQFKSLEKNLSDEMFNEIKCFHGNSIEENFNIPQIKVIISNLPFGKKITNEDSKLIDQLWDKYQPDFLGVLHPSHWKHSEKLRKLLISQRKINHGGIDTTYSIFSSLQK